MNKVNFDKCKYMCQVNSGFDGYYDYAFDDGNPRNYIQVTYNKTAEWLTYNKTAEWYGTVQHSETDDGEFNIDGEDLTSDQVKALITLIPTAKLPPDFVTPQQQLTEFSSEGDVLELVYNAYRQIVNHDLSVYDNKNNRYISNEAVEKIIDQMRGVA